MRAKNSACKKYLEGIAKFHGEKVKVLRNGSCDLAR
jgi:hypothetical protein